MTIIPRTLCEGLVRNHQLLLNRRVTILIFLGVLTWARLSFRGNKIGLSPGSQPGAGDSTLSSTAGSTIKSRDDDQYTTKSSATATSSRILDNSGGADCSKNLTQQAESILLAHAHHTHTSTSISVTSSGATGSLFSGKAFRSFTGEATFRNRIPQPKVSDEDRRNNNNSSDRARPPQKISIILYAPHTLLRATNGR